jgi:hypothetical protein
MGRNMYVAVPCSSVMVMSVYGPALGGAVGADALDHIIDGLAPETVGQLYGRNVNLLEAEGSVARFAVKMHVAVIVHIAGGVAEFVSDPFAAVINLVQEMILVEKGEGAENTRFVYGVNLVLQLGNCDGPMTVSQRFKHQQTVCSGLDPVLLQ